MLIALKIWAASYSPLVRVSMTVNCFVRLPSSSYALSTIIEWSCLVSIVLKFGAADDLETNTHVRTKKTNNASHAFPVLSILFPPHIALLFVAQVDIGCSRLRSLIFV